MDANIVINKYYDMNKAVKVAEHVIIEMKMSGKIYKWNKNIVIST